MARRAAKRKTRRRDTRPSILDLAQTVAYGSILTNYAFGDNLVGFFLNPADASGDSLRDIIQNPGASFERISDRVQNPDLLIDAAMQSVITGALFKLFAASTRTARSKTNRGLKQLGLPVKV